MGQRRGERGGGAARPKARPNAGEGRRSRAAAVGPAGADGRCREALDEAELVEDQPDAVLGNRLREDGRKVGPLLRDERDVVRGVGDDTDDCGDERAGSQPRSQYGAGDGGERERQDALGVSLLGPVTDLR